MKSPGEIFLNNIISTVTDGLGSITLDRPEALNALSPEMIEGLTEVLEKWRNDPSVDAVAIRGSNKKGPFGAFCAGGDIRFFHRASCAGDTALDDFFTAEYRLNHIICTYPKPYIAFMDGIVMGGGMGLSQGASLRIVTERTKMAMPETNIGLFPDVGAGIFLSRCPGASGEYLALTGQLLIGGDALAVGLADHIANSEDLDDHWRCLADPALGDMPQRLEYLQKQLTKRAPTTTEPVWLQQPIDVIFALDSVTDITDRLAEMGAGWPAETLEILRQRSPLMLHVTLEQIRRGRHMNLEDDLRMERDLVQHCFYTRHLARSGISSETVEGIRALAIDKDHSPAWNPPTIAQVTSQMVAPFFASPWSPAEHPLADLGG